MESTMAEKKEKEVKKVLKLAKRHPANRFRVGRHVVTQVPSEFSLNESEVKELSSKGCKAWIKEVKKEK